MKRTQYIAYFKVPYREKDNNNYLENDNFCCGNKGENKGDGITDNEDPELNQFYYHSDHLGSSSYITNLKGSIVQHVEYVPFGEVFLEERNNKWNTPYLFNGKELDEETGLYYYGARYYSSRNSIFLSVDRFAEKYPGVSPYQYCLNNPINALEINGDSILIQGDANFIKQTNVNVEKIRATDLGAQMLNKLESSKKTYRITEAMNRAGAGYNSTIEGGDIDYDPTPWTDKLDGGAYNGLIGLSHELAHAYDDDIGNIRYNKNGTLDRRQIIKAEKNAVMFQNYITKAYNLGKTRNVYGSIKNIGSYDRGEKISDFKFGRSSVSFKKTRTVLNKNFKAKTTIQSITRKVTLNKSYIPWYYKY